MGMRTSLQILAFVCLAGCVPPDTPSVQSLDALEKALQTGNAAMVNDSGILLNAALASIDQGKSLFSSAKIQIFNLAGDGSARTDGSSLTAMSWNPSHDSAFLTPTFGRNEPILTTNDVAIVGNAIVQKEIGLIGETGNRQKNKTRYMVLGGNPLRNAYRDAASINAQMHQFMENSLSWLTRRNDLKTKKWNAVIAQMDDGYYFPDERAIRQWLGQHYADQISYNDKRTCNGTALEGCIAQGADILIVSQVLQTGENDKAIAASVKMAMDQGIPVLYFHHDGDLKELGSALFSLFDVTYEADNYWRKFILTNFDASKKFNVLPIDIMAIQKMLLHFKNHDFSVNLSLCDDKSCSANATNDAAYKSEFKEGADRVKAIVNQYDISKMNIFASEDSHDLRFQKLLILLGDQYRKAVVYPMDKVKTEKESFLKSLFADHAVYNFRKINPVQPNMGNFSRSNFSFITPIQKRITLTSKRNFRAAGVYALPGQTFTITRTDHSAVETTLFINTLSSGATHEFETNGYKRPKYLQTPWIIVKPDAPISITSPYGGPIQIGFDGNDFPVAFEFNQIGEHPFWNGSEDNVSFAEAVSDGRYDWAEVVTSGFEVHATLEKMRTSMDNPNWNTASKLAAGISHYTNNFPLVLAGLQGHGIDVVPEIHDFAARRNWTISTINKVQHMNADQATCGYGCSGNPYDAYWAFDPLGHGDLHEFGHGLENGLFRFEGWDVHASTNYYSYYTKSKFYKETSGDPDCQELPFKKLFETLQRAATSTDPSDYMQQAKLTAWSDGAAIYVQMMMSAQNNGILQNGWHLLARLHLMEREFSAAKKDDTSWLAKRNSLGLGQYAYDEIKTISNNDWLVNAISLVTETDHRDYLNMWGLGFSAKANTQVASFNYPVVARKFYISDGKDYCNGLDKIFVPIDGTTAWPLP